MPDKRFWGDFFSKLVSNHAHIAWHRTRRQGNIRSHTFRCESHYVNKQWTCSTCMYTYLCDYILNYTCNSVCVCVQRYCSPLAARAISWCSQVEDQWSLAHDCAMRPFTTTTNLLPHPLGSSFGSAVILRSLTATAPSSYLVQGYWVWVHPTHPRIDFGY